MPTRKLTDNDIDNILALLANGMTQKEIADKHDVTRATISDIKCGKTHAKYRGNKLCDETVSEIKERISAGDKQIYLAALYNVSQPTISRTNRGIYWK